MINAQLVADAIASFATQIKSMFSKQLTMDTVMIVSHRVTGGGGTLTSGSWRTRPLNLVERNSIAGASLTTNQITLPAGDYYCEFVASAFGVNAVVTRLQDTTGATEVVLSDVGFSDSSILELNVNTKMNGSGYFSLSVESVLELQSQSTTTRNNDGLGMNVGFSDAVHAKLVIYKVG